MNRPTPWLTLLTILLLAQGCSGILTSDEPAKQVYLLKPLGSTPAAMTRDDATDLALQVTAIPGLDTDQILALGSDARLQQYSNARWPDHLPEVLTSTLQRSLESTGQFTSVRAADHIADQGWLLRLELREFYGIRDDSGDTSSVRVALAGSINCGGTRHSLSQSDSNPVSEQRLASVVAAHQAGLNGVTRALIARIQQACGGSNPE